MNYQVFWASRADTQLVELWLGSRRRSAVSASVHRIEASLARCPEDIGESRSNGFRVAFDSPIGIVFRIDEANRLVSVVAVWEWSIDLLRVQPRREPLHLPAEVAQQHGVPRPAGELGVELTGGRGVAARLFFGSAA